MNKMLSSIEIFVLLYKFILYFKNGLSNRDHFSGAVFESHFGQVHFPKTSSITSKQMNLLMTDKSLKKNNIIKTTQEPIKMDNS